MDSKSAKFQSTELGPDHAKPQGLLPDWLPPTLPTVWEKQQVPQGHKVWPPTPRDLDIEDILGEQRFLARFVSSTLGDKMFGQAGWHHHSSCGAQLSKLQGQQCSPVHDHQAVPFYYFSYFWVVIKMGNKDSTLGITRRVDQENTEMRFRREDACRK